MLRHNVFRNIQLFRNCETKVEGIHQYSNPNSLILFL